MVKSVFSDGKGLVQSAGSGVRMEQPEGLEINSPAQNGASYQIGRVIQADITVADGATSGKSSTKIIPAGFICHYAHVVVRSAAANAVTLNNIGTDADKDAFIDGATMAVNSTGDKGTIHGNGVFGQVLGMGSENDVTTVNDAPRTLLAAADEMEIDISGDPGADTVIRITLYGVVLGLAS